MTRAYTAGMAISVSRVEEIIPPIIGAAKSSDGLSFRLSSVSLFYQLADFVRHREKHGSSVAHRPGGHDDARTFLRAARTNEQAGAMDSCSARVKTGARRIFCISNLTNATGALRA
jgi:hypothetical protein